MIHKKIVLKKKVVAPPAPVTELVLVPSYKMEPGVKYINMFCNVVLEMKEIKSYEGPLTGVEALRHTEVICHGYSHNGDCFTSTMFGTVPVIADQPELEAKIMRQHGIAQGKIANITAEKRSARPPKIDEATGKPIERKPRGEVDKRTGCSVGSQGHVLGTIMLDNKCSPATREKCVFLMTACLKKDYGFTDEKKAKALAQSWYSTLWTRKPQYYQGK